MPLIYLSTDELNRSLVREWGEWRGIDVECPAPKDRVWGDSCDAVALDLDHATSEWLATLATRLEAASTDPRPVAVHGYGTAVDAFRGASRGRAMAVYSRLRPRLLRELARAADASAPVSATEEVDALTWVDLV